MMTATKPDLPLALMLVTVTTLPTPIFLLEKAPVALSCTLLIACCNTSLLLKVTRSVVLPS